MTMTEAMTMLTGFYGFDRGEVDAMVSIIGNTSPEKIVEAIATSGLRPK